MKHVDSDMVVETVRETIAVLRESQEAIREGRTAIHEARVELEARYERRKRQVEDIERAIELLRANGPDTDLQRLVTMLSLDRTSGNDVANGEHEPDSHRLLSARSTTAPLSHRDSSE
ncbi:hypothetical protein SAMN05421858_0690 [Haladaptatus litoreus]|uniref:Uncharacterized protein n=1 Tax=Haladaptatus litoreus TaxID=553468 RepID=A0A1N6WEI9_9EURY|nr:hypothetical protein [Haladaptatus litoreus]SIQ88442.1 hypothetical protein SAMN05421858_0690 [Haladaptatus litoreus]